MKTPFKYLTFIGTALIVATGSSAAFAQSSRYSNFYDSVCSYTPQNRYCIGTNYSDRIMNSADMMTQPNTSNDNQTNQPLNSNDNSRSQGTYQQTIPNQSSNHSNPGTAGNQDPGVISPGNMNK
jgi:hypothetical protein